MEAVESEEMEESDDDEVMVSSVGEDTISVYNKRKKVSAWQKTTTSASSHFLYCLYSMKFLA